MARKSTLTHYRILNLPSASATSQTQPSSLITPQLLKQAYHRALLAHHPDKDNNSSSSSSSNHTTKTPPPTRYTIDQITLAYKTLLDPRLRAEYDREIRLKNTLTSTTNDNGDADDEDEDDVFETETERAFRTGLETIDLDDMKLETNTDSDVDSYTHPCRCGTDGGYVVTEQDLEEAAVSVLHGGGEGEVVVPCRGCSLWIRVLFGIEEEDG